MKKTYEKPKIEAVTYAANTSLCGSCANAADKDVIDNIAMMLDLWGGDPISSSYFMELVNAHDTRIFSESDRCSIVVTEYYCKFTFDGPYFLS